MTHEQIYAELSAFALGALDRDEHAAVAAHLAGGCAECERELHVWREVVGNLGMADSQAGTPDLKPKLLREIEAAQPRGRRVPLPQRWLAPLALAAGALLAVVIGREWQWRSAADEQAVVVGSLRDELRSTHDALQSVRQQLAAKEQDASALRAALAATQESLSIVQGRGLQMVRLSQTADAKPAEGHVLISPSSGRALFYAFELGPVPAGKTYELWWITEKQGPINAGLFVPDPRGIGRLESPLPANAGAIQAAAVTIEPSAGVDKPTGPMVLLGKL